MVSIMSTWSPIVFPIVYNSFRWAAAVHKALWKQKCEKCPTTLLSWPSGGWYTAPPAPRFRCEPCIGIYYHAPGPWGPIPTFTKVRNHCARGSPPKSRISGHVNSRLLRGASKQGQTKGLSYFMGEGWKDKQKGRFGLPGSLVSWYLLWCEREFVWNTTSSGWRAGWASTCEYSLCW